MSRLFLVLVIAGILALAGPASAAHAMQLFVALPDGSRISLDVEPADNIEAIKAKVQDKIGLDPGGQFYKFEGTLLEDGRTLADYGIDREDTLQLRVPVLLEWTDSELADFREGVAYRDAVQATTGVDEPRYLVNTGALPAGIELDERTGELTGVPSSRGPWSFSISAVREKGEIVASFSGVTGLAVTGVDPSAALIGALGLIVLGTVTARRRDPERHV